MKRLREVESIRRRIRRHQGGTLEDHELPDASESTPFLVLLFVATAVAVSVRPAPRPLDPPTVHAVADISQEFTFYMDGRFHRQYLKDVGAGTQNWGTLSKLDLDNVNLLLLVAGNPRIPYSEASIEHVRNVSSRTGGTVLLMGNGADPMPPGQAVAAVFDARFTTMRARKPINGVGELDGEEIVFNGGTALGPRILTGPRSRRIVTDGRCSRRERFGKGAT